MMTSNVLLEPLDVIYSNDPRPVEDGGFAQPAELQPQVIAGAWATQILEAGGYFADRNSASAKSAAQAAGVPDPAGVPDAGGTPKFRLKGNGWWHPEMQQVYWPTPRHLLQDADRPTANALYPAFPALMDDCIDDGEGTLPLKLPSRSLEPSYGYISLDSLCKLFAAPPAPRVFLSVKPASDFYVWEQRSGHTRAPNGVVMEGKLYSRPVMRPREHCVSGRRRVSQLAIFLEGDEKLVHSEERRLMSLGGDGRQAIIHRKDASDVQISLDSLKTKVKRGIDEGLGLLLYLATPAPFVHGWRPRTPDGMTMLGAAVDRPITLSGWDVARQRPKPILSAAPAGSVYFYSVQNSEEAKEFVDTYHFAKSLCDSEKDYSAYGRLGYGLAITGVWDASAAGNTRGV
ncbi:MAG TPA: type III-B CRISPR module-associated Cmr3 family protein [Candidatus Hydrogenedentes bacterium]|nr:type III-B CRISPR module-associated Cmr3 family protein [Candidatus Hydrogenedentota bacterium]HPG70129.1 type III-B CRISPR module-associated Cmr3 family protein [Candidatus Hydrogenedentota bacterium]